MRRASEREGGAKKLPPPPSPRVPFDGVVVCVMPYVLTHPTSGSTVHAPIFGRPRGIFVAKPASCPGKKPRPGMMVGFELEFVSRLLDRKYGGPSSLSARRISVPWGKLGEDGGCYELRTLPVPAARAREVLFSCLSYLESVSARARADDGLHVNVSLVDKAAHFRLNPLDVWMLADPRKWSLRFGRSRCWSCMAPSRLSPPIFWSLYRDTPTPPVAWR